PHHRHRPRARAARARPRAGRHPLCAGGGRRSRWRRGRRPGPGADRGPRRRPCLRGHRRGRAGLPAPAAGARRRQCAAGQWRARRGPRAADRLLLEQALPGAAVRRLRAGARFSAPVRLACARRARGRRPGQPPLSAVRPAGRLRRHAVRAQQQGHPGDRMSAPHPFRTLELSDPAIDPRGLRFATVKSAALRQRADVTLWLPLGADQHSDLPVAILLHGVYGSHWAWALNGDAHGTAGRLIEAGAIPPMALLMPSDGLWGDGSGYVRHRDQDFEAWIVDELPALALAAVPGCSARSPLLLAGLSMGGFAALRLVGKHPRRFLAAAAHSAMTEVAQYDALLQESREGWGTDARDNSAREALAAAAALPPLRFDCGRDDPFIDANRALHAALDARGIAHQYAEHDGGHDWTYWSRHLEDTLRFFGAVLRATPSTPEDA